MTLDQNGKEFLDHVFTGVGALLAAGASVAQGWVSGSRVNNIDYRRREVE